MDLTNINKSRKDRRPAGSVDLTTMVYGKVPPQAKDLEEAILGAIMLESRAFDTVSEILQPDRFYVNAHELIFRAMQNLAQKSVPIDIMTVTEQLRKQEQLEMVGGPYYVTKLTNTVVSSANLEAHCRIVLEMYMKREVIRLGGQFVGDGYDDAVDVFDLIDRVETDIMALSTSTVKTDFRPISSGLVKVVHQMEDIRHRPEALTGVTSGFPEVDRCTNGWQKTDLIILAARPSVGKTAFALNLARNAAMAPDPVGVGLFSLEMSESQLVQRILSAESGIFLERIKNGRLDDHHMAQIYHRGVERLHEAPIYIDDSAALNIFELRAKARRMKNKFDVGLIIIDYLQLMSGDTNKSDNREREIAKISRELKRLAKDLEVPLIALSQLSRAIESRASREPQLSDLRESGAIEQDADLVGFLYRPSDKEIMDDRELENKGMVKIAKHRNGSLMDFVGEFHGNIQKWTNLKEMSRFSSGQHSNMKPISSPYGNSQGSFYEKDDDEISF
ncbi:replicative DNA helicase [Flavihumibacter petaseus]|uniref:Replicative DNA helicase n=1 Tax=Flavihumibacter petaseus NBRC 106054 TaxID=1220578 RepID=A0A0E9N1N8_9BACT|nr:replicative DNA helicase [Flavihumibacter petaseus]GAO43769.1 replicative DNA helicase [Flavihumibacter petaseus NBRC 106054]